MQDQDKQQFAALINATRKLYNLGPESGQYMSMYFTALSRFSFQDVRAGISAHTQNPDKGQFMPKPADIVRELEGNTQTQSGAAWTKVDKAIRRVGLYQTVIFDDPIIHKVIDDMGGWIMLCQSSGEEYPFKQNEFERRYRGYINREVLNYPRKLIGLSESHNARHNLAIAAPVAVGDQDKALLVYKGGSEEPKKLFNTMADFSEKLQLAGSKS